MTTHNLFDGLLILYALLVSYRFSQLIEYKNQLKKHNDWLTKKFTDLTESKDR